MRLFIAFDIDETIRERISRFVEGVRNFAPGARWMKPESLHVTLKFIGEQPDAAVDLLKVALSPIKSKAPEIEFRGYGFFPTPKSARVFWIGMSASPELATIATSISTSIDERAATLGIPKDARPYNPHLTVARAAGGSGSPHRDKSDKPNPAFEQLQDKLATFPRPEFGTMTPREFILYQSHLSPKGSTYSKLARFPLK